jgi:GAF domain-containing protein
MLEQGHRIPKGKGLVGRAAESNTTVLVPDVSEDPGWLPNPLLPETRCEVAIPVAVGDTVLGVLDVQHNAETGLIDQDVTLLQAVADQVALAVQNAKAYTQLQREAGREARIAALAQQIRATATIEEALKVAGRAGPHADFPQVRVRLATRAQPGAAGREW